MKKTLAIYYIYICPACNGYNKNSNAFPPPVPNHAAIDMTGCGDSSALEVVENSRDYVITCNNVGGTGRQVTWEKAAGDCVAVNNCQSAVAVIAVLSRPSYSTSTMTVKSATRPLWGNKVVRCYTTLPPSVNLLSDDSCTLDVVCKYMQTHRYSKHTEFEV